MMERLVGVEACKWADESMRSDMTAERHSGENNPTSLTTVDVEQLGLE